MATEIRQYVFTIPAGTAVATPVTMDMSFPPRVVDAVEFRIPPGPNGVMGFALLNSNLQIIPYNSGQWIVTNDEVISWPLHGAIDSGSWQIKGYNTGRRDHAVYVRFLLSLVPSKTPAFAAGSLSMAALSSPAPAVPAATGTSGAGSLITL